MLTSIRRSIRLGFNPARKAASGFKTTATGIAVSMPSLSDAPFSVTGTQVSGDQGINRASAAGAARPAAAIKAGTVIMWGEANATYKGFVI